MEKTQKVTRPLLTKDWSLMHLNLPSRTQYVKKINKVQKTYMKLKSISEPKLRHVHCNHWSAGKDLCDHKNLIWSSDPKWNLCFLLFNGRSSTQTLQWHHKLRLKLWRTVKQFTFTPTDSKQQQGMFAKAACQEMKVLHLWQLETKYQHW